MNSAVPAAHAVSPAHTAPGLVGDDAARAVRGFSRGADVALLPAPGASPAERGTADSTDICAVLRELDTAGPQPVQARSAAAQLRQLADIASASVDAPLVLACADLRTSVPAVLDLLDKPGVVTAVATVLPDAVAEGVDRLPPARVGADGRLVESVGTGFHVVTRPSRLLVGVLRVDAADRPGVAATWREAAAAEWAGADPFALAVLAVVRAGVPVQAVPLGPFTWSRTGVAAPGASGGPWQQRLRGAPRGGDGLVSTLMTRRLSRPLTGFGLRHGWSPNVVTVASLSAGLLAAALVATGQRWAWVLAAVLLQVALVVDCVDGEIARFTRRFSAFGAWLDAVGDRLKEYTVCAALGAVAVRQGHDGWILALAAMALVSMRHFEDFPYAERLRSVRQSRPDRLPLAQAWDGGPEAAPTTLPPPPSPRSRAVLAVKQVLHLPIAERYLLICLGLLTFRPRLLLWALIVAVLVAAAYTQGGRVVRAVARRDGWQAPTAGGLAADRARWGSLDHQLDLGPLARPAGRRLRLPFVLAPVGAVLLAVAALPDALAHRLGAGGVGVAGAAAVGGSSAAGAVGVLVAVLAAVLLGGSTRPPVRHRLAWQLPVALWLAEVAVICGVALAHLPSQHRGPAFAFAAAVAYHRYDAVYRLRDTGTPPAPELALFGLGCDGRILLLLAVAAWAPGALAGVLAVGAAYLAVLYAGESALGWRRAAAGAVGP